MAFPARGPPLDPDHVRSLQSPPRRPVPDKLIPMRGGTVHAHHTTSGPQFDMKSRMQAVWLIILCMIGCAPRKPPRKLDIHIVVDNYATHKHPAVKRWLGLHERWHVHYTPTYASWLNQLEIWFNIITQKAVRRGTFRSVKELVAKIQEYVDTYNRHPRPFVRTATADSIFDEIKRLTQQSSETAH